MSHISGRKLSQAIRTSMAATDLVRGMMRMHELKDYYNDGPNSPGYSVYRASTTIALLAEGMIASCIILFQWQDVPTFLLEGTCTPPVYDGFLLGDIDLCSLQNYGLALADSGVIGGWPGWPVTSPALEFQISGDGPTYLITALCDDGKMEPNVTLLNYGVQVLGRVKRSDTVSFQSEITVMYPANTLIDDATGDLNNFTVSQNCYVEYYIGSGNIKVSFTTDQYGTIAAGKILEVSSRDMSSTAKFPTSATMYVADFKPSFMKGGKDKYGVKPLVQEAVRQVLANQTYYPSQGSITTNFLSWVVGPDGYYHTGQLEKGISATFSGIGHYALMQFDSDAEVPCPYFSVNGHGTLLIPPLAVIGTAIASALAIFVKLFEIMWWAFTTAKETTPGYHKAIRALNHPLRLAIDTSEALKEFTSRDSTNEFDPCDSPLKLIAEKYGGKRLMYGEDSRTVDENRGHLRIGKYGTVRKLEKDRTYGSGMQPLNPELEEYLDRY
ncbi:hypothetical protein HDU76_009839 [Blyttiomyces sp. JEL0837]|nr:hypothetical protein HDU76_009839 [Blyttiomyces sp. JEL0837]